jgi:hypothetical protein
MNYNLKYRKSLNVIAFLLLFNTVNAQVLIIPPNPGNLSTVKHLTQSNDYTVDVKKSSDINFTSCFVYKTDNYASNLSGGEKRKEVAGSFTNISFSGTSVDIKITASFNINSVIIRPLDYAIIPVIKGNTITFTLTEPKKISIEANNRLNPLFLFADAPDVPNLGATYYYGPGIHNIGMRKKINSNESVYIAGGAIVEGTFLIANNATNIEVRGRGIISNGSLPTLEAHSNKNDSLTKYSTFTGTTTNKFTSGSYNNTKFEGIIITNSAGWNFGIPDFSHKCHHNSWRNIKEVTWSGCTDGIWFDGDNNLIDDCFIFNNDDLVTSHGSTNCTISNCTMWGGNWGGHLFYHDDYASSSGITYENINVIGIHAVSVIWVTSRSGSINSCDNLLFKNIRIEQHPADGSYWTNKLLLFDLKNNSIKHWKFEKIAIDDKNADEGDIYGTSTGLIDDINFCDLKMGGAYVNSLAQANMDKNPFAENITFCATTGIRAPAIDAFSIYPNPSEDYIIIEGSGMHSELQLYDLMGKKVVSQSLSSNESSRINLSALNKGIYMFTITSEDAKLQVGKLIKK